MHIGLDLRPALKRPTGVGSYVRALALRLPRDGPQHRFFFFSASLRDRFAESDWPQNVSLTDWRLPVRALNLTWNRLNWPKLDSLVGARLDLAHSPHPLIIPTRRGRHVVTLHDLFFLKHPELTHAEIRRDYSPLVRDHTRRADGIICVSEHTARDAVRLLDLPREKLTVIPNGVDPIYRSQPASEDIDRVLAELRLPRGGFLYVGSTEPRKNLTNLVAGHEELAQRRPNAPPLILLGPDARWASDHGLDALATRAIGYLERAKVRALMAASLALVLPSLEEGFGLPVAEAMAAGLPVVCSRGSALEEVAGDAACFVDPLDPASIALAMERLLDEPSFADGLRKKGLARSRAFDWDLTAAQTLDFYQRVIES